MRALLLCLFIAGCIPQPGGGPPPDAHGPRLGPLDGITSTSLDTMWTCTSMPCPWGPSLHNQAIVWPAGVGASNARIGYTANAAVYLPIEQAAHLKISLTRGTAQAYIGRPGDPAPWPAIGALTAGELPWPVPAFGPGYALSVESTGDQFEFVLNQELP